MKMIMGDTLAPSRVSRQSRHRRMLRDKFLHQVRTDKAKASRASIEEGKKVGETLTRHTTHTSPKTPSVGLVAENTSC